MENAYFFSGTSKLKRETSRIGTWWVCNWHRMRNKKYSKSARDYVGMLRSVKHFSHRDRYNVCKHVEAGNIKQLINVDISQARISNVSVIVTRCAPPRFPASITSAKPFETKPISTTHQRHWLKTIFFPPHFSFSLSFPNFDFDECEPQYSFKFKACQSGWSFGPVLSDAAQHLRYFPYKLGEGELLTIVTCKQCRFPAIVHNELLCTRRWWRKNEEKLFFCSNCSFFQHSHWRTRHPTLSETNELQAAGVNWC